MRILIFFFLALFSLTLPAQTNGTIRALQSKRTQLQKQITQKEKMLNTTKKDVRTQLRNLSTLSGQIEDRKRYIQGIEEDVTRIDSTIRSLDKQLDSLARQLQDRKDKYARSLQRLYRARSLHEKLMFIFSSSSLSEAYRRSRYLQDYAGYQRVLAGSIRQQQEKIGLKRKEQESVRAAKADLMREGEQQKKKLEAQEEQKRTLVSKLQSQQKGLQREITKHRTEANKLNAQIDRLVAIEIEKARKRAEEEARRKAAEEAARKKAEQQKSASSKSSKSQTKKGKNSSSASSSSKKTAAPKMEAYKMSSEDARLTGTFASNKGRLPMPITGSYLIAGRYGQYTVEGMRGVRLDNKGINIQGQPGAQARAVYDGEVASVFHVNGLANIIVRHGTYLSVYCNLSSVRVAVGQKVSTRQTLGSIFSDPNDGGRTILHFQLRKETTKLNPEQWLAR